MTHVKRLSSIHWFIPPMAITRYCARPKPGIWNSVWDSNMISRGPSATLRCPSCISKALDHKQSSQGLNWYSRVQYQLHGHCMYHNISPRIQQFLMLGYRQHPNSRILSFLLPTSRQAWKKAQALLPLAWTQHLKSCPSLGGTLTSPTPQLHLPTSSPQRHLGPDQSQALLL